MLKLTHVLATALAVSLSLAQAAEKTPAPDKSAYSLLHRTPEKFLRDLSTDRPDLTESPFTVDAGWWQIESDLVNFTRDHDTASGANVKTETLALGSINLKVGLTTNIDLQTVIETYTRVRTHDRIAGTRDTISGFGDITSRLKINVWGNDGGDSGAFALMPFIKWPTNRHGLGNQSVEGGLIVPYARDLPGGWGLGVMTEFDLVRNDTDTGYATDWLNTVTVSHDLTEKLGCYLELTHLTTRGPSRATFDCGLTYGVNQHVQLDTGVNLALTRATEDLTLFVGLSVRF